MAPRRIIIDTDPGVDDIMAMLLALAALPEELEVLLISVTYGNIDVQNCLRNVVSLFHHIEKEIAWREQHGKPPGFDTLLKSQAKPLVAIGPEHPLADEILMADFFHGLDGLGGIHSTHPHLTPADTWKQLFQKAADSKDVSQDAIADDLEATSPLFTPSNRPAHEEILRLLRENEPDTITIVAIGPLTNLALAAAADPHAFLRAREVVVMGGSINAAGNPPPAPAGDPGLSIPEPPFRLIKQASGPIRDALTKRNQITPVAEFNTYADTVAAARVYALTSPNPHTTMPPTPPAPPGQKEGQHPPPYLASYPTTLGKQLKVTMFPVDITNKHVLTRGHFRDVTESLRSAQSPLAEWCSAFLSSTFAKVESLQRNVTGDAVGLQLHDPMCIWYCMAGADAENGKSGWELTRDEDIRIETAGQWTRGMCVVDTRTRKRRENDDVGERPGDAGNWLSNAAGNRLRRCTASPDQDGFGRYLLKRVFNL